MTHTPPYDKISLPTILIATLWATTNFWLKASLNYLLPIPDRAQVDCNEAKLNANQLNASGYSRVFIHFPGQREANEQQTACLNFLTSSLLAMGFNHPTSSPGGGYNFFANNSTNTSGSLLVTAKVVAYPNP